MQELILSDEQNEALDKALNFLRWRERNTFVVAGLAGTGKTTVAAELVRRIKQGNDPDLPTSIQPCAFTGKAVSVLRKKGVSDARTIHSLIYNYRGDHPDTGEMEWDRAEEVKTAPGAMLCDEGSMLDTKMLADLVSFGLPVLIFGDQGQLPPIKDDPFIMKKLDVELKTIHRQAQDNPVIAFAYLLRFGKGHSFVGMRNQMVIKGNDETCGIDIHPQQDFWDHFNHYHNSWDVVICGTNATRVAINQRKRKLLGKGSDIPTVNDHVICLENDAKAGIFNGQIGVVDEVLFETPDGVKIRFHPMGESYSVEVLTLKAQYNNPVFCKRDPKLSKANAACKRFDYAYALTAHKSQGSEWDRVAVWDQSHCWEEPHRWQYTAATRTRKRLSWFW